MPLEPMSSLRPVQVMATSSKFKGHFSLFRDLLRNLLIVLPPNVAKSGSSSSSNNLILGVTVAGLGIWVLAKEDIGYLSSDEPYAATSLIYKSAYIIITFGFTVAILGFVGCCAVCFERSIVLCCFASCFTVPLLLVIAALILAWYASEDSKVRKLMEDELTLRWKKQRIFSVIEKELSCCGVRRYTDYEGEIPLSCFINATSSSINGNATNATAVLDNIHQKGCLDRFIEVLRSLANVLSGLATTLLILMTISVILALGIRRASKMPSAKFIPETEKTEKKQVPNSLEK